MQISDDSGNSNDNGATQLDSILFRGGEVELHKLEQIPAPQSVAQRLCDHLIYGFSGCSEESHERQFQSHIEVEGDNHYGLSEICFDPGFPSVLHSTKILSQDNTTQERRTEAAQWNEMFCGASHSETSRASFIKNVCIHKEQTQTVSPDVSFDVDSFLGFATLLKVARNGILYQPSPQAQ